MQDAAVRIDYVTHAANAHKQHLESKLGSVYNRVNELILTDAAEKRSQIFDQISTTKAFVLKAKHDFLMNYYGSNTVIDNNSQKQKDKLWEATKLIYEQLREMRSDQQDEIETLYTNFEGEVTRITNELSNKALEDSATRSAEIKARDDESSQVDDYLITNSQAGVIQAGFDVDQDLQDLSDEEMTAAQGWPEGTDPDTIFESKTASDSSDLHDATLEKVRGLYESTVQLLDLQADSNKASAKALRAAYNQNIDRATTSIVETYVTALGLYYEKLEQFGITQDAAITSYHANAVTKLGQAGSDRIDEAKAQLGSYQRAQTGLKTPKAKQFQADLDEAEKALNPVLSQAESEVADANTANEAELERLKTTIEEQFKRMEEEGSAGINKLITTSDDSLEQMRLQGIEDQRQLRRDHLNGIIRDVRKAKKKMEAEVAGLSVEYEKKLATLETDLSTRLSVFELEAKAILAGLDDKMDAAEKEVQVKNAAFAQAGHDIAVNLKKHLRSGATEDEEAALDEIRGQSTEVLLYAHHFYKVLTEHKLEQDFEDLTSASQFKEAMRILRHVIPLWDLLRLEVNVGWFWDTENEGPMLLILETADAGQIARARAGDFEGLTDWLWARLSVREYYQARKHLIPGWDGIGAVPADYEDELFAVAVHCVKNATWALNDDENHVYNIVIDLPREYRERLWLSNHTAFSYIDGYDEDDSANYAKGKDWTPEKGTEIYTMWILCWGTDAEMFNERMDRAVTGWGTYDEDLENVVNKVGAAQKDEARLIALKEAHEKSNYTLLTADDYAEVLKRLEELGGIQSNLLTYGESNLTHDNRGDESFLEMIEGDVSEGEYKQFSVDSGVSSYEQAKYIILNSLHWYNDEEQDIYEAFELISDPELRAALLEDEDIKNALGDLTPGGVDSVNKLTEEEKEILQNYVAGDTFEIAMQKLEEAFYGMDTDEEGIFKVLLLMSEEDRKKLHDNKDEPAIWKRIQTTWWISQATLDIIDYIVEHGTVPMELSIDWTFDFFGEEDEMFDVMFEFMSKEDRFKYRLGYWLTQSGSPMHPDFVSMDDQMAAYNAFVSLNEQMEEEMGSDDLQANIDKLLDIPTAKEFENKYGRQMAADIYMYRIEKKDAIRDADYAIGTWFSDADDISEAAGIVFYGAYEEYRISGGETSQLELLQLAFLSNIFQEKYDDYVETSEIVAKVASTIAAVIVALVIAIASVGSLSPEAFASLGAYLSAMWGPAVGGLIASGMTKVIVSESIAGEHYDVFSTEGLTDFTVAGADAFFTIISAGIGRLLTNGFTALTGIAGPELSSAATQLAFGTANRTLQQWGKGVAFGAMEGMIEGAFGGVFSHIVLTALDEQTWRRGLWDALLTFGQSAFKGLWTGAVLGGGLGGLVGGSYTLFQLARFRKIVDKLRLKGMTDDAFSTLDERQLNALNRVNRALEDGDKLEAKRIFDEMAGGLNPTVAKQISDSLFPAAKPINGKAAETFEEFLELAEQAHKIYEPELEPAIQQMEDLIGEFGTVSGRAKRPESAANRLQRSVSQGYVEEINSVESALDNLWDALGTRIVLRSGTADEVDQVVAKLADAVKRGDIEIVSVQSLTGEGGIPYLTSQHLDDLRAASLEAGGTMKTSPKTYDTGYTVGTFFIKYANGVRGELQLIGSRTLKIANAEHWVYDAFLGKPFEGYLDVFTNPQVKEVARKLIERLRKPAEGLTKEQEELYKNYLNEAYKNARRTETGAPTEAIELPPGIPEELSVESLLRTEELLMRLKSGPEHVEASLAFLGSKSGTNKVEIEGLEQDARGVYGYLPRPGSRYHKFRDKFMDPEWVAGQREIRAAYLKESKKLEAKIQKMRAEDKSAEEIARYVVNERNLQKVAARKNMQPEEVATLEEGNMKKYGNPVGPTADDLYKKVGDWKKIIASSMRKDPEINRLLGLE